MPVEVIVYLGGGFLVMALLYATVGHGGGSGYLAVMALAGLAPEMLRPTALSLNLLVAGIGTVRFFRAGAFTGRLFWPFVITSIPAAFLTGMVTLDPTVYKWGLGVVLLFAAFRLAMPPRIPRNPRIGVKEETTRMVSLPVALVTGGLIGGMSGLIGVGGGIFLSPILLLAGWGTAKQTAGVSAPFILVNSMAGLMGIVIQAGAYPVELMQLSIWGPAVVVGGFVGAGIGARRLGHLGLRRLLAVVLVVAGAKMFLV